MRIERLYSKIDSTPYDAIAFASAKSEIRNPDGSMVFPATASWCPAAWRQVAADMLAQKYFRRAGVPARLEPVEENGVPEFLWRNGPTRRRGSLPEGARFAGEPRAKQVFDRLAGAWTYWGWKAGYFDNDEDAAPIFDEMRFMLAAQTAAPNSPQWFNTGLLGAYGVDGPGRVTSTSTHEPER